jgi:uncharacterized membrane protein
LRQYFAKLLQLLAGVSVLYVAYLFVRKKPSSLPLDYICLSMAGIALLVFMVALPTLSLNYGVLRSFQQSLIFLVIPMVLLLARLGRLLWLWLRVGVAAVGMAALFLLFTGFFAQLLGGVSPALTLNNHGLYYGMYYTTKADMTSYEWLQTQLPPTSDVRSASYAKALMHYPKYPFSKSNILPTQRPAGSYVYLDQAQLVADKLYVYHEGSPLIITFPVNYYQDQTNQIYSTGTTGVYR